MSSKTLKSEIICSEFKGSKQLHKYIFEKVTKKETKEIEEMKFVDIDEKRLSDEMLPQVRNYIKDELKKDIKDDLKTILQKLLETDVTIKDLKTVIKNNTEQIDIKLLQKNIYLNFNIALTPRQIKSLLII